MYCYFQLSVLSMGLVIHVCGSSKGVFIYTSVHSTVENIATEWHQLDLIMDGIQFSTVSSSLLHMDCNIMSDL